MKVAELIQILRSFDQTLEVCWADLNFSGPLCPVEAHEFQVEGGILLIRPPFQDYLEEEHNV